MSLASEPDHHKADGNEISAPITPILEAAIPLLEKANVEQQRELHDLEVPTEPDQSQNERAQLEQSPPATQAIVVAEEPRSAEPNDVAGPSSSSRPRRSRASLPVYNLSKLSGTDMHGKRRTKDEILQDKKRRTISEGLISHSNEDGPNNSPGTRAVANSMVQDAINALELDWSIPGPNTPKGAKVAKKGLRKSASIAEMPSRRQTRLSGAPVETLATKLSSLGKRSRKTFEKGLANMSRELRRLRDTNEFAHIESVPVRYTVWSNGKYFDPVVEKAKAEAKAREEERARKEAEEAEKAAAAAAAAAKAEAEAAALMPPSKKVKLEDASAAAKEIKKVEPVRDPEEVGPVTRRRRVKKWFDKGLYAGQDYPEDISKGLTVQEKKQLAQFPELSKTSDTVNRVLPPPMFNGLRMLLNGRDFKLPFDVCHPLPPGQPKPASYRTIAKSKLLWPPVGVISPSSHADHVLTLIMKIASSVMPPHSGRKRQRSRISLPSASASPKTVATKAARIASCCMNATRAIAMRARGTARTVPSRIFRREPRRAVGIASGSRCSRRTTAALECVARVALRQTRSSWSTRARSSPRRSASAA
jgi:hypothetical protein